MDFGMKGGLWILTLDEKINITLTKYKATASSQLA